MQYQIRKWTNPSNKEEVLYYPRYAKWWWTSWREGSWCRWQSEAEQIIQKWKKEGVPETNVYIKVK